MNAITIVFFVAVIFIIIYILRKRRKLFNSPSYPKFETSATATNSGKVDMAYFKGQKCEANEDCENLACGRLSAKDDAEKYCCPYGPGIGVDMYGGFDYCYNMPEDAACFSDAMCMDGYECVKPPVEEPSPSSVNCWNSAQQDTDGCALYYELAAVKQIGGITKKGKCRPIQKKVGDVCNNRDITQAGVIGSDNCPFTCGKTTFDAENTTCCEEGRTSMNINGDIICDQLDLGQKCQYGNDDIFGSNNDVLCKSGFCMGDGKTKYCVPKPEIGDHCNGNRECPNGCGRNGDSTAPLVCCEFGTKNILGYDYCSGNYLPGGAGCRSDDQCQSGNCQGNMNGVKDGFCSQPSAPKPLLDNDKPCKSGYECASNLCGYAANGQKSCCPLGPMITVNGRDYCPNMTDGGQCVSDEMCQSKKCQNGACSSACGTGVCGAGTTCIDQSGSGVCCKTEQVCMSRDNVPMCCGDGSHCDSVNHLCIKNRP